MNISLPRKTGHLHPSSEPRVTAVTQDDHSQGTAKATVTLVEYGDFECPHCGHSYETVKEIQRRLGAELRFVFRHFPLTDLHPNAENAAEAAEAAAAQGEFWRMHDTLFENQSELDELSLVRYAERIGLDTTRFALDLRQHTFAPRVRRDHATGHRDGVKGTPTFFIDEIRHDLSHDLDTLLIAIETAAWRKSLVEELS